MFEILERGIEVEQTAKLAAAALLLGFIADYVGLSPLLLWSFKIGLLYWFPMVAAKIGLVAIRYMTPTYMPYRGVMSLPLGVCLAYVGLKLGKSYIGYASAYEEVYAVGIGFCGVVAMLWRRSKLPDHKIKLGTRFIPIERIEYVLGGWSGMVLVTMFWLWQFPGASTLMLLAVQILLALAESIVTENIYLTYRRYTKGR